MQKLALFDLDDTLVDRRAAFNVWAEEFAAARGLGDRDLTFLVLAGAHHAGPMDGFFAMICEAFDLSDDPGELWRHYRRRMPELVSCRAEDLDALLRLRAAGWRIGIVTNGMADNQLAKIRNTGLDELVDGWAISSEVGCRKPDPDIFRLAAARCGANRALEGWVIGDSLTLDVAGGHAAGMRTIWLRSRAGPRSFDGPAPDLVVDTVADAVDALLAQPPSQPSGPAGARVNPEPMSATVAAQDRLRRSSISPSPWQRCSCALPPSSRASTSSRRASSTPGPPGGGLPH